MFLGNRQIRQLDTATREVLYVRPERTRSEILPGRSKEQASQSREWILELKLAPALVVCKVSIAAKIGVSVAEARGQFGNLEEWGHPPLEAWKQLPIIDCEDVRVGTGFCAAVSCKL
jgi:hypothetical protein